MDTLEKIKNLGYTVNETNYGFCFGHVDFDGGPLHAGGPPLDIRCGTAKTLEDCLAEIIEIEAELADN